MFNHYWFRSYNNKYRKLKLLGSGDVKNKFDVEVNFISKSAKEKIEKSGGKVILIKQHGNKINGK